MCYAAAPRSCKRALLIALAASRVEGESSCGETSSNGLSAPSVPGPFVGSWMHPDSTTVSLASALGITPWVGRMMTGTLSQPVSFTGTLTTTGRALMSRDATTAGASALADSPVPGPGDVLAAAILVVGVAHVLYEVTVAATLTRPLINTCPAGSPPVPAFE